MVWTSVTTGECQRGYQTFHFEDYVDIFHKTYQSTGGNRAVTERLISCFKFESPVRLERHSIHFEFEYRVYTVHQVLSINWQH